MDDTDSEEKKVNPKGTMYRVFKLLAWVNGLAAIVLAVLLALPSFIDWGVYKDKIRVASQEKLGAHVTLEGAVYAQFLPVPVLKLNRVILAHPSDHQASPVKVKRVDVELNFLSFISGEFEPRAFLLHEADFHIGLAEDKSWLSPVGLREMVLGSGSHNITRFGVKKSRISFSKNITQTGPTIENINFVAEKSDDANNWSIEGYFQGAKTQHGFQLMTRTRPDKNITFIDAQVKMTRGGDVVHSFNGSVSGDISGIVLNGLYKSAGGYGTQEDAISMSARGRITVSEKHLDVSGATMTLTSLASDKQETGVYPAILNADIKMHRAVGAGKWTLKSELSTQNLSPEKFASLLPGTGSPLQTFVTLNNLASFFNGAVSLRGQNLKFGHSTYPRMWANIIFADDLVHISDSGLSLPNGGSLQTDRVQGVYETTSGSKKSIHRGAVYLKSDNIQDLAVFLPSVFLPKKVQGLSTTRTPISLSGLLQIGSDGVNFKTSNLSINGAKGSAEVNQKRGEDSGIELTFNMEKFNADRFFKSTQKSLVAGVSGFFNQRSKRASGDSGDYKTKLHISVDRLFWRATALKDFKLRGNFSGDRFTLARLSAGGTDEEGFHMNVKGQVKNLSSKPVGSFDIELASSGALDTLSLLSPEFLVSKRGRALSERAHLISPLSFKAKISSQSEGNVSDEWRINMDGRIASTSIVSEGAVVPAWREDGSLLKNIDLQFEVSNESSRALAGQLFSLEADNLNLVPEAEGYLRASITGSQERGFDIAFGGEVSDVQVTLGGNAKIIDGAPAIAAQVKFISPDSRSMLSFAGVKTKQNLGKTEYVANLAGSAGEYVLSGGSGILWGRQAHIEARMDFVPSKPVLTASISTDELRLPTLQRLKHIVVNRPDGGKNPFRFFDTRISLATPLLSLFEGVDIEGAQLNFAVLDNKLTLSKFTGQLYGGNMLANGTLEQKESALSVAAHFELQDASFERALIQENLDKIAQGQFTLAGELTGSGQDWQDLGRALNGRGYIKARGGEIEGINPAAFGRSVRFISNGTELDAMIGGILTQGTLPYRQFQTAFTIKNSILETNKTQLISREVRSKNKTRIDLISGNIKSDWQFQVQRLPNTPAITLSYAGTRYKLKRSLQHKKLRHHLMALMGKGENLSQRFAAQIIDQKQKVDPVLTGSLKRKMMKKPIKLDGLKIVPQSNPLRGSN